MHFKTDKLDYLQSLMTDLKNIVVFASDNLLGTLTSKIGVCP